jgi:hypothetical protein
MNRGYAPIKEKRSSRTCTIKVDVDPLTNERA